MLLYLFVGYIALYSVIWLHEVGHAFFYKKYGCKNNFLQVTVPLYLIFSTPQPINLDKEAKLNLKEKFIVSLGGIVVNLFFGLNGLIIIKLIGVNLNNILHFFLYIFVLFHFIEAASYTVINNIYVASDIVAVQEYKPKYRILLFIIGILATYIIINLIINCPQIWKLKLTVTAILTSFMMGGLRIIFSILVDQDKETDIDS